MTPNAQTTRSTSGLSASITPEKNPLSCCRPDSMRYQTAVTSATTPEMITPVFCHHGLPLQQTMIGNLWQLVHEVYHDLWSFL